MKNLKYFTFLAIVAIFALAFAFTACSGGSNDDEGSNPDNRVDPIIPPSNITYTVIFNANGGSGTAPTAQTAAAGSGIILPGDSGLSKSGYTFGGWNTNTSGTGTTYSAGSSYTVTGNITLYAKWDAVGTTTYTVIFNANGGSGTAPNAQTVAAGSVITLPGGSDLLMSGYTFGGWNTSPNGTETNYSAGSSYTVTGNITLYAKWNVALYTVTFNANGGSGTAPVAQTVAAGSGIILPGDSGLSKSGYAFGGWNTNTSGTGDNHSAGSYFTPPGNIELYARWVIVPPNSFTVSFNSNGGDSVGMQIITSGGTASRPTNPTRACYGFDDWYSNEGLTYLYNFSTPVSGNITLYAKWSPNTAGITLDVKQITEGAPVIAAITISRTNNGYPVTFPVTVSNASDYTSIMWEIAGAGVIYPSPSVTGSGATFTLDAADNRYNSLGGHALILTVTKDGMQYQRAIPFTIVQ